ncbi:hypothetical protein C8T65DRAFT_759763 [Cerioporus squamosus]|nr:hypothetical protein C8T65DRAFT_759763 [Cerioporus squamosus]
MSSSFEPLRPAGNFLAFLDFLARHARFRVSGIHSGDSCTVVTEIIAIYTIKQSPLHATVDVTVDNLRNALGPVQEIDDNNLEEFLDSRFSKVRDKEVPVNGHIHCECTVLARLDELWRTGVPIIPYVGLSKPSCAICHSFFEAYRKVTGQVVKTWDTNGRMVPWRCPTIEDLAGDESVRSELSRQLRILLVANVEHYGKRSSTSLWGTTSSDDVLPSIRPTFEDLMFKRGFMNQP